MFQTEPILFLQSLASDWLTSLMVLVSAMGYAPFYIGCLGLVTLGIDFRRGFLLIQMVLWAAVLTDLMKNGFGLPRPSDVDSNILHLGKNRVNDASFTGGGARGFFELMDPEAIRVYRAQPEWSFGFPSGHVSSTTTFWGGMSLLFNRKAIWVLAGTMIVLMPLSRMYMGRHFLADVLGGFALGGTLVLVAYRAFMIPGAHGRLLSASKVRVGASLPQIALMAYLLLGPFVVLSINPTVAAEAAGRLLGLNIAFLLVGLSGFPDDGGSYLKRAGRVVLGPVLYLMTSMAIGWGVDLGGLNEVSTLVEFTSAAAAVFMTLWGTVQLSLWTGLYRRGARAGIY